MSFDLEGFHRRRRSRIIKEWGNRLKTKGGEQYAGRSRKELTGTVTEAFDANCRVS